MAQPVRSAHPPDLDPTRVESTAMMNDTISSIASSPRRGRASAGTVAFATALVLVACGAQEPPERKDLEAAAEAALGSQVDPEVEKARALDEAKRKEEFAKNKAAEEKASAEYDAIWADIIKLPEKLPKNLDAACDDMLEAYKEFKPQELYGDDAALLDWYDNKKIRLGERRGKCVKLGSVEAAACQAYALRHAPGEGKMKGKDLELLSRCADTYAKDAAAKIAAEELAAKGDGQG
jgi:hypothetical protein